jgi:hypothetical protein
MSKHLTALAVGILAVASAPLASAQGYGGPSMLSRGGNLPGQRGRAPVGITVYGALRGTVWESGLTPIRLDEDGTLSEDNSYGAQAEIGAYGTHSWRKTTLGLDYRGDYRYATLRRNYNGTNQALSLDILHTATRRTAIFFRETGGSTNRAFGGFLAPSIVDPLSLNLANDEVFDTRTYFSQTSGGVSYRASARMTYTLAGDGFFTKRPDPRLVGVSGYRASGDADYRLTSRTAVGGRYHYMVFQFPRIFGDAEMQGAELKLIRRVTRNLELNFRAGAAYVKSSGTQQVQLSPEVAALLGRRTGVEAFTRSDWIPLISATAAYTLERSRFTAAYATGVSPGNGVYLTSARTTTSLGYSFTGIRKLSMGVSGRHSVLSSKSINLSNLSMLSGGGGLNYALTRYIDLSTQFDYRTFRSGGIRAGREGFYFAAGLSVSPARIPLSMW